MFERCGFSEVQGQLFQFLRKQRSDGENVDEEALDTDSLFYRFLMGIQRRLNRYIRSFSTTLQYDEDLLLKIRDELRFSSEDSDSLFAQQKNLDKLQLSVHYRLLMKRHWVDLCCSFRASCCSSSSNDLGLFSNVL